MQRMAEREVQRMFAIRTQDPDAVDRGRIAKGTALLIGVGTLISLGNSLIAYGTITALVGLVYIALLIIVGVVFGLAHAGYVRAGATILTATLFLAIAALATPALAIADPTSPSYVLPILVAGLLLNGNAVLLVGALSLVSIGVVQLALQNDWTNRSTSSVLIIVLATGLIWVTIRRLERALVKARQQTQSALESQQTLVDQQTALQAANKDLLATNEQMTSLLTLVRDLETPVIPLLDGVLVMPLVGHVDTRRASQLTESVLTAVHEQRARVVIIDITGVSVVDTAVAQRLGRLAQSVQLLGAHVLLTGIRADVAQTIVMQGIDFSGIQTAGRLQDGVAAVLNHELRQDESSTSHRTNHHAGMTLN
jgi:anti-anti-sigma regulatory factor